MLVVAQSSAIINNIYEGLVWFIFPCLLVISNDTFAYIFGFFLGKTRLIELSPKKTWEGFVGGFFSTLFWAMLVRSLIPIIKSAIIKFPWGSSLSHFSLAIKSPLLF
jgi:phosphatidate cytidylyltransferase